ncbi:MAG: response regulator [Draconibacterium sp.]|nr:response regulator [Draconibacterium sp.]
MMKILICDDHKIVRVGIKHLLQQLTGVKYIEEAGNGDEALTILKNNDFDIVLLDISLPGISGLEVLEIIKAKHKHINVLMLSMHPQEQYAIRALKLGASGYLTKDTASEELIIAVNKIATGGKYISLSLAENLALYIDNETNAQKHDILSKREFEIMLKLANGKSLQEIGDELFISNKTVSTYRTRIMGKMDLSKNTELTKYCLTNNLI